MNPLLFNTIILNLSLLILYTVMLFFTKIYKKEMQRNCNHEFTLYRVCDACKYKEYWAKVPDEDDNDGME